MVKVEDLLQQGHLTSVCLSAWWVSVWVWVQICPSVTVPQPFLFHILISAAQLSPLCLQQQQQAGGGSSSAGLGWSGTQAGHRGPAVQGGSKGKVAGHIYRVARINVKFRSTLPLVLWFLLCYLSCEHSPNENQTFSASPMRTLENSPGSGQLALEGCRLMKHRPSSTYLPGGLNPLSSRLICRASWHTCGLRGGIKVAKRET